MKKNVTKSDRIQGLNMMGYAKSFTPNPSLRGYLGDQKHYRAT